jgi:hypothetical protein
LPTIVRMPNGKVDSKRLSVCHKRQVRPLALQPLEQRRHRDSNPLSLTTTDLAGVIFAQQVNAR